MGAVIPKCVSCGTDMKPLFTTYFCPNECDLPPEKWSANKRDAEKRKADALAEAKERTKRLYGWHPWFGYSALVVEQWHREYNATFPVD